MSALESPPAVSAAELVDRAGLEVTQPELLPLVMGLLGGLALFLYGLEQLTSALKAAKAG